MYYEYSILYRLPHVKQSIKYWYYRSVCTCVNWYLCLQRKGTSFGNLVIIGTIVGAILGIAVQIIAGFPDDPSKVVYIKESTKWFSLVGGGFIDLIRMLVIPIVFISIVHVILHMEAGANLKKLVVAMVSTNLGMVAVAAIVGLILGNAFGLGQGFDVVESGKRFAKSNQWLIHSVP